MSKPDREIHVWRTADGVIEARLHEEGRFVAHLRETDDDPDDPVSPGSAFLAFPSEDWDLDRVIANRSAHLYVVGATTGGDDRGIAFTQYLDWGTGRTERHPRADLRTMLGYGRLVAVEQVGGSSDLTAAAEAER